MSNEYETLMRCVRSVRTKTDFVPKVALVLGSGLGDYASQLRVEAAVDYHEIEGFSGIYGAGPYRALCVWLCRGCAGCVHAGTCALL